MKKNDKIFEAIDKSTMSPEDFDIAHKAQIKAATGMLLEAVSKNNHVIKMEQSDMSKFQSEINNGTVDLNKEISEFVSPLHAAVIFRKDLPPMLIPVLMDAGADPHKRTHPETASPFELAIHCFSQGENNIDLVKQILERSKVEDIEGFCSYHENGQAALLHYTYDKSIITTTKERLRTLGTSKDEEVEFLNRKDRNGQTVLHLYASQGNNEAIEALLDGLEPQGVLTLLNETSNSFKVAEDYANNPQNTIKLGKRQANPTSNLIKNLRKKASEQIDKQPINGNVAQLPLEETKSQKMKAKKKKKSKSASSSSKNGEEAEDSEKTATIESSTKDEPTKEKSYSEYAEEFLIKRFEDLIKEHNHTPESFAEAMRESSGAGVLLPAIPNKDGSPSKITSLSAKANKTPKENLANTSFVSRVQKTEKASYSKSPL